MYLSGRIRYPRRRMGETVTREDGRRYTIFREIDVRAANDDPAKPGGVFQVWFYARGAFWLTRLYSYAATLFFVGQRGFRHKLYLRDAETGELGGIYHWNTVADAEAYANSFAMALSARRSVPGRFRKEFSSAEGREP
jgi:hypothetical protein